MTRPKASPLFLRPAGKDYLWGGTRLKREFGKDLPMTPLAETWEVSVHPEGESTVEGGAFDGWKLSEVIASHPEYLGKHKEFPLLLKLIDAKEALSIQVHPDEAYATEHEGEHGKTELWYVLDAKPDSKVVYGFEHPVTKEEIRTAALREGDLHKHLHYEAVKKGDVFLIRPGTVHAIGAGALIVEIAQNSNVTYRICDYNRIDKRGLPRELHIESALSVLKGLENPLRYATKVRQHPRLFRYSAGSAIQSFPPCEYFQVERIRFLSSMAFVSPASTFQVFFILSGEGTLARDDGGDKRGRALKKGTTLILPAESEMLLLGDLELLRVTC